MSKWLKGKEKLFNQFKEEKKKEQEDQQQSAGPRRTDIVWPTPDKGTVEKPKVYQHRLLPDKNGNFYKSFYYHMYKSVADDKWNFVFCDKSHDMGNFCGFCAATVMLYKGSKTDKAAAYNYKRKRKHCVNSYIGNDPRDADAESEDEKMTGKVKIYEFPDKVEAKIKSEMNDESYGAGINIFDPGEDGVDFILKVGSTKPTEDGKTFPDYSNSKFASKPMPISEDDSEIESIMESTHDLDEYLKTMERSEENIVELLKKEMLWEYVKSEFPDTEEKEETPKQEEKLEEKTEDPVENTDSDEVVNEEPPLPDEPEDEDIGISDDDLLAELEALK